VSPDWGRRWCVRPAGWLLRQVLEDVVVWVVDHELDLRLGVPADGRIEGQPLIVAPAGTDCGLMGAHRWRCVHLRRLRRCRPARSNACGLSFVGYMPGVVRVEVRGVGGRGGVDG